jgi:hypothetical protein
MKMLIARVTATLHALQFTVITPRCSQQPPKDPAATIKRGGTEGAEVHATRPRRP